jgi:hypothetical protein
MTTTDGRVRALFGLGGPDCGGAGFPECLIDFGSSALYADVRSCLKEVMPQNLPQSGPFGSGISWLGRRNFSDRTG